MTDPTPAALPTRRDQFQQTRRRRAGACAQALGASDAGAEVSEGVRPVGRGAQGRDRERRAQPRQVARRHRLRRPAARQRQHLRLLARRARADGAGRLRHRPLHRRRPGRRPARRRRPGHRRGGRARPRPVPPLGHRRRAGGRAGAALRGRGAGDRPPHHQLRRRRRVGAAVALLGRQHARLSRRLCELAPLAVGGADRRAGKAATTCSATTGTARCATRRRAGRAGGGGPLCRRARAVAPGSAQDRHRRGAGAVRVDRWPPACSAPTCRRVSGGALYRKSSFLLDSLGKQVLAPHLDIHEDPHVPRGKGSAPFDDEGVRTRARDGGRGRRAAGLLPVAAIRRASSA